ncbi:hypothetical protein [Streptomyces sp. NPDC055058]
MMTCRRRLLLAVDAKGYGRADVVTQRQLQGAIQRILTDAAGASGLERERWETQVGGDSVLAVLPEGASEPHLVDTFMRHLDAGLREFNHGRLPGSRRGPHPGPSPRPSASRALLPRHARHAHRASAPTASDTTMAPQSMTCGNPGKNAKNASPAISPTANATPPPRCRRTSWTDPVPRSCCSLMAAHFVMWWH